MCSSFPHVGVSKVHKRNEEQGIKQPVEVVFDVRNKLDVEYWVHEKVLCLHAI